METGKVKSCGHLVAETARSLLIGKPALNKNMIVDLTGQQFGFLKAISLSGKIKRINGSSRNLWECECICGRTSYVTSSDLTSGNTNSCGCITWHGAQENRNLERQLADIRATMETEENEC